MRAGARLVDRVGVDLRIELVPELLKQEPIGPNPLSPGPVPEFDGPAAERGYTTDSRPSRHADGPEPVSDEWLERFAAETKRRRAPLAQSIPIAVKALPPTWREWSFAMAPIGQPAGAVRRARSASLALR